ncbi:CPBP family glutamic-type intramembrane protease [Marilutibacter spongiae]|uniref:CPBP family intramembrane metalloprotease n=1 Tax=Marilutibacter spongiae TaxID=2025720 RepID=A0A7W3TJJ0_9GAMM|nr:CPBP family intramembrane metalloprotease [Lysobacter spongiae]
MALLNVVVTLGIALAVSRFSGVSANPAMEMLRGQATGDRVMFFLRTLPQLFGEEVITVLPFLAIAWLLHMKCGLGRTAALVLAWLGAAVLFGMAHLPTYDWNWVQCLVIIGSARLVLLLGYLKTRNIWVSTGAHIINDWLLFGAMLLLSGLLAPA